MDILFKQDDFVFSYRVGGVLIRDGKILLQGQRVTITPSSAVMLPRWKPPKRR